MRRYVIKSDDKQKLEILVDESTTQIIVRGGYVDNGHVIATFETRRFYDAVKVLVNDIRYQKIEEEK